MYVWMCPCFLRTWSYYVTGRRTDLNLRKQATPLTVKILVVEKQIRIFFQEFFSSFSLFIVLSLTRAATAAVAPGAAGQQNTIYSYRQPLPQMGRASVRTSGSGGGVGAVESRGASHHVSSSPQTLEAKAGEHGGHTEMTSLQRGQWRTLQSRIRSWEMTRIRYEGELRKGWGWAGKA